MKVTASATPSSNSVFQEKCNFCPENVQYYASIAGNRMSLVDRKRPANSRRLYTCLAVHHKAHRKHYIYCEKTHNFYGTHCFSFLLACASPSLRGLLMEERKWGQHYVACASPENISFGFSHSIYVEVVVGKRKKESQ